MLYSYGFVEYIPMKKLEKNKNINLLGNLGNLYTKNTYIFILLNSETKQNISINKKVENSLSNLRKYILKN